jgi:hypothetical protein
MSAINTKSAGKNKEFSYILIKILELIFFIEIQLSNVNVNAYINW